MKKQKINIPKVHPINQKILILAYVKKTLLLGTEGDIESRDREINGHSNIVGLQFSSFLMISHYGKD